jgi:hypothetical protein
MTEAQGCMIIGILLFMVATMHKDNRGAAMMFFFASVACLLMSITMNILQFIGNLA